MSTPTPSISPVVVNVGETSVNPQKTAATPLLDRIVQAAAVVSLVVLAVIAGLGIVSMVASGQLLLSLIATTLGAVAFAVTLLSLNRGGFLSTVRKLESEVSQFSLENANLAGQVAELKTVNKSLLETNENLVETNDSLRRTGDAIKASAKKLAIVGESMEKATLQLTDTSVDLKATSSDLTSALALARENLLDISSTAAGMGNELESIHQMTTSLQSMVNLITSTISKEELQKILEEMQKRSQELEGLKDCCREQKVTLEQIKKEVEIQEAINKELAETTAQLKSAKDGILKSMVKQADITEEMKLAAGDQHRLVQDLVDLQTRLHGYAFKVEEVDVNRAHMHENVLTQFDSLKEAFTKLIEKFQKAKDEAEEEFAKESSTTTSGHDPSAQPPLQSLPPSTPLPPVVELASEDLAEEAETTLTEDTTGTGGSAPTEEASPTEEVSGTGTAGTGEDDDGNGYDTSY
ncbi:hypothetical protein [Chlamydiifrater phoenicopteri]|uniref:hypothetical protein n=1 Tax=Chlamydiifrater phoenicopteri TaxID=2681469 RepID=UPI001BCC5F16|nr:hypothetical protein [Chlamydiifrater phoenicopteri]